MSENWRGGSARGGRGGRRDESRRGGGLRMGGSGGEDFDREGAYGPARRGGGRGGLPNMRGRGGRQGAGGRRGNCPVPRPGSGQSYYSPTPLMGLPQYLSQPPPSSPIASSPQGILITILTNGGKMSKKHLIMACRNKVGDRVPYDDLAKIVDQNIINGEGIIFNVEKKEEEETVTAVTNLGSCKNHITKEGCSNSMCGALHLCKYFLSGRCQYPGQCLFGHNLRDQHNYPLLASHLLDQLQDDQINSLLSRTQSTYPRVCKFYNVGDGKCRAGDDGKSCNSLHVCRHYIQGTCTFGSKCKRSHNIYDPQAKALLVKHCVDVQRSPKEVLVGLREACGSTMSSEGSTTSEASTVSIGALSMAGSQASSVATIAAPDSDEICTFYLRGMCNYGKACRKHHCDMPYQWQCEVDGKWTSFDLDLNEAIELNYSNPADDEFNTLGSNTITFSTMTGNINGVLSKVRRLGTHSSVHAPSFILTTKWNWFWQDEFDRWNKYGATTSNASSITESDIERNFQDKQVSLEFTTPRHQYTLMFDKLVQRNNKFGTERPTRRRPEYVSRIEVAALKEKKRNAVPNLATDQVSVAGDGGMPTPTADSNMPAHWDRRVMKDDKEFHLVQIKKSGSTLAEYFKVEKQFHETMSPTQYPVKKISRIQNIELWERYTRNKSWKEKKSLKEQEERLLFHGTNEAYMDAICQQGFDWRISGSSNATAFGKGIYFARDATYSKNYTPCNKMFLVRVLVGEYGRGRSTYVKPPPIDPNKPLCPLYDSCVNDVANPSIFIIFEQDRSYAEYIIEY